MMTREEFDKLSDDEKYQAYLSALSANKKEKDPFSLVKLINRVRKLLGRELDTEERLHIARAYKWCQKKGFVWNCACAWRYGEPIELNDFASWIARKINENTFFVLDVKLQNNKY